MIKVLIICKDNETAKSIVNYVISRMTDLRLIGIGNTLKEGVQLLKKYEPTLIFTTSINFLNYLNENAHTYTPGVILISKVENNRLITYRFKKLLLHIQNTNDFKFISEKTFKFVVSNYKTSKKRQLRTILEDIGFDFKLNGTQYLLDTLLYITTFQGSISFSNLISEVYPFIGRKNGVTPQVVKWAILRSFEYLYAKSAEEAQSRMQNYFDITPYKKITPKIFIQNIQILFEK